MTDQELQKLIEEAMLHCERLLHAFDQVSDNVQQLENALNQIADNLKKP